LLGLALGLARFAQAGLALAHLRREQADLRALQDTYLRVAIHDPLTRLFNKGYFEYRLPVEWARAQQEALPLALIAFDLDNFKQVNDRWGHAAGDTLLAAIGEVVRATMRGQDCPCRVGGDEFLVIAPHTTLDGGVALAERLQAGLAALLARRGLAPLVGVSAGVSGTPVYAPTLEALRLQADEALYSAKQQGKNRVISWLPAAVPSLEPAEPPL
jgi:diguanylate cyclase (GGDEF)-like protein